MRRGCPAGPIYVAGCAAVGDVGRQKKKEETPTQSGISNSKAGKGTLMQSRITKNGVVGIISALVLVLVTYLVADAASGPLLVTQPGGDTPEAVPLSSALGFTVIGGAVGIGLGFVANRLSRPRATFVAVAVVALALYGILPFTAAEETSTASWLNAMHVAAALPIVGLLARSLPEWSPHRLGSHPNYRRAHHDQPEATDGRHEPERH